MGAPRPTESPAVQRILIAYEFALAGGATGDDAGRTAGAIALEQTVEVPESAVPPDVMGEVVGRVESLDAVGSGRWRATVSYEPDIVGGSVTGLINLVFGNVSMLEGVRVAGLELPAAVLGRFRGPAFGIQGIRHRIGAFARPLLCVAAKPLGLSAVELARRCGVLAAAGVDAIKDDHSLADQRWAPFAARVMQCADAVGEANARSGGRTIYLANLLPGSPPLDEQLALVREAGCAGVVLSPWLAGFGTLQELAAAGDLVVMAHPAYSQIGARGHGVGADVLFGTLCRVAGADAVIYPNAGGRFPMTEETCRAINQRLGAPLGDLRAALPVAGGGVDAEDVTRWIERYGSDIMFLMGSALYASRDLGAAARRVVEVLRRDE